jgi:hypothetical protein
MCVQALFQHPPVGKVFPPGTLFRFFWRSEMDREFFIAFLRWLETASDEELLKRQADIQRMLDERSIRSSTPRKDAEFMIRKIEEERIARLG